MSTRLRQPPPAVESGWRRRHAAQALIRLLSQSGEPPRWEEWLPVFEQWCVAQGWHVEYESVEDESCAIFFCQALTGGMTIKAGCDDCLRNLRHCSD